LVATPTVRLKALFCETTDAVTAGRTNVDAMIVKSTREVVMSLIDCWHRKEIPKERDGLDIYLNDS
jgi:hypothetical protein